MTTELMGGAPASEALPKAREARNERIRGEIRAKALEAAEARMLAEKKERERKRVEREKSSGIQGSRKRKPKLVPAWEE